MTYVRQYTVRVPSAFESYFSGTGTAQGTDIATPVTVAVYKAWYEAQKVKAGGGHSWLITGPYEALDGIRDIAVDFLNLCGPGFSFTGPQQAAARIWVRRINNTIGWPEED